MPHLTQVDAIIIRHGLHRHREEERGDPLAVRLQADMVEMPQVVSSAGTLQGDLFSPRLRSNRQRR